MIKHKCWGIGLGRTGTKSFCQALGILGYKQVIHNPRFGDLKNMDGGADNGVTIFYKYLDYKFPGSKFVLALRDYDEWIESIRYITDKNPVTSREMDDQIMRRMMVYESVTFDKQKFTDAYHRHHDDVRRYFKDRPDDLLEMKLTAGEGWEKLCPFLGLPVPDAPFPHLHKRAS